MLAAATILSMLTLWGWIGPWSLLLLTFLLSTGSAMNGPTRRDRNCGGAGFQHHTANHGVAPKIPAVDSGLCRSIYWPFYRHLLKKTLETNSAYCLL
jgi:hypothetical protein